MEAQVTPYTSQRDRSGDNSSRHRMLPAASLREQHHEAFIRAMVNVLSTEIAEVTYAQIIDGLPLSQVARDTYNATYCPAHPLFFEHFELPHSILERARELKHFDTKGMRADARLLNSYQATTLGSKTFETRLVELVAVAVHQLAARLFKSGPVRSKDDILMSWRPSKGHLEQFKESVLPTLFVHGWYLDFDQYPEGVADGVGYWAESRIFGGVVLFDKRMTGRGCDAEPEAIYLHADRKEVTYRIYKLLDCQRQQLVRFLLCDTASTLEQCPLPIIGNLNNWQRVDPETPLEKTGIYRDLWERRPLLYGDSRLRTVVDTFNYLSEEDWDKARLRGYYRMTYGQY